jgi:hypothetical protein
MNPVTLLVQLFMLCSLLVIAVTPFVVAVVAVEYLRTHRDRRRVIVTSSFALGLYCGGWLAWSLIASSWAMPFWTTIEASVDAEKYGHLIEHTAENILFVVTLASMCCGVLSVIIAAFGTRSIARLKHV